MNLKLLANQVFLREKHEHENEQDVNIGPKNVFIPKNENEHEKAPFLCPYCDLPAVITDVCLSDDRERTLTLWRCDPCGVVAVTPDEIRQPPVWVTRTEQ